MMKVRQVGAVDVSPDGQRVVYAADEAVMGPEKSEYRSNLHVVKADGTDELQLTYSDQVVQTRNPAGHSARPNSNPHWSPDGEWIAFVSGRSGKSNIWLMRMRGGEAFMLTDVKTGIDAFSWSPDGKFIAFLAPDPVTPEQEKSAREKNDAWVVTDNTTIVRNVPPARLWLVSTVIGSGSRFAEARLLTKGQYSVGFPIKARRTPFDWSPNSKSIVFVHTPSARGNEWTKSGLSVVDVDTGAVSEVAAAGVAKHSPLYSPDSHWIAYVATDHPASWSFDETVRVIPATGGASRPLAETYDRQPTLLGWNRDSQSLLVTEAKGTGTALYRLPLNGAPTELTWVAGTLTSPKLNHSRTMLGFGYEEPELPPEVSVSPVTSFNRVQVSQMNAQLPALAFGRTEVIRWKSKDGLEIEGLLTYPTDYKIGQRYPLILAIHGGPQAVFSQQFIASRVQIFPVAVLASEGYAVLRCNIRGSGGYGKKFRFLNRGDWGGKDFEDLMAGVDHVIQIGVADPERLGVTGESYGGYMTSWTITQTRRFRGAVIIVPVTNLVSFTGTTDVPDFIPDIFGGQPWEIPDVYRSHSPLFYASRVKTPSLILAGALDDRAPITQSYEFFNALKHMNVVAEMVVWPRSGHVVAEPKLFVDAMRRIVDWFNRYVKPQQIAVTSEAK